MAIKLPITVPAQYVRTDIQHFSGVLRSFPAVKHAWSLVEPRSADIGIGKQSILPRPGLGDLPLVQSPHQYTDFTDINPVGFADMAGYSVASFVKWANGQSRDSAFSVEIPALTGKWSFAYVFRPTELNTEPWGLIFNERTSVSATPGISAVHPGAASGLKLHNPGGTNNNPANIAPPVVVNAINICMVTFDFDTADHSMSMNGSAFAATAGTEMPDYAAMTKGTTWTLYVGMGASFTDSLVGELGEFMLIQGDLSAMSSLQDAIIAQVNRTYGTAY